MKTNVNLKKNFQVSGGCMESLVSDTLLRLPILETIHFFQGYSNN